MSVLLKSEADELHVQLPRYSTFFYLPHGDSRISTWLTGSQSLSMPNPVTTANVPPAPSTAPSIHTSPTVSGLRITLCSQKKF
jgi:hypothetical protein